METLYPSSFMPNPAWFVQESHSTEWTKEQNKLFESALAIYDKDTPDRWLKVAAMIPGKTVYDVIKQYRELLEDVSEIEAGRVPIPGYLTSSFTFELVDNHNYDAYRKRPAAVKGSEQERKKGVLWTEDEHRRFLMGLLKYGKGDWRNISRNFVVTKTPTQVASHAQKYYIRQQNHSGVKDRRRPSIHDITIVNLTESITEDNSKPLLLNESPLLSPQHKSPKVQAGIASEDLKLKGQDLYDCLHGAYTKFKAQGFRSASKEFNQAVVFGIHAL
ncbi:hypothetical protein L6164_032912 [Bauhinia variegata]|uniref:Uncharacterized protein n=1 Tax=Bauhinia variegata TaxID=167791 RepID=A0ACB9KQE3_BAUVA|nr:hypothetical protein L6164_032912 [Bauhinia variegata]